jgi:hypothetical protein
VASGYTAIRDSVPLSESAYARDPVLCLLRGWLASHETRMPPGAPDVTGSAPPRNMDQKRCSEYELKGLQKASQVVVGMQQHQQQQQQGVPKQADEQPEGFTRSISLYWHWVRGQKAASKLGKVRAWMHSPGSLVCSGHCRIFLGSAAVSGSGLAHTAFLDIKTQPGRLCCAQVHPEGCPGLQ